MYYEVVQLVMFTDESDVDDDSDDDWDDDDD